MTYLPRPEIEPNVVLDTNVKNRCGITTLRGAAARVASDPKAWIYVPTDRSALRFLRIVEEVVAPRCDRFDNGEGVIDGVGDVDNAFSAPRKKFLQLLFAEGVFDYE